MPKSSRHSEVETPSVDTFCKNVLRSCLLDRGELQAAVVDLPADRRDDARALADHLIKKGKLSRFQASKLLKGTAKGFILGPYQIVAPLGKGGMGTVYMARDQRTGRLVALKVLAPERARTEERTLERFKREMELCRRVAHPHIAMTFDVGLIEVKGVYYIAMEYIPGKSLYRLVGDEGPLNVPRVAHFGLEIAAGLEHAHKQGLIHRDLKPSNVVITPHDHAKILDFGLALVAGEKGSAEIIGGQGYIVGSMDYISPEQTLDASKVDARADVYGLGCLLFFALTGQPPFPGGTSTEKIYKQRNEVPPQLSLLRPDVPMDFADIIHRMMAKDPGLRLPTARVVVEALRPWALTQVLQPLDRPDDTEFRMAVAALHTAESSTEFSQTDLPPVDDSDAVLPVAKAPDIAATVIRPADDAPFHERRRRQAQLQFFLILGGVVLAVLLGGGLLLTCLIMALFRH
jgi:serine/threonine protein kinase